MASYGKGKKIKTFVLIFFITMFVAAIVAGVLFLIYNNSKGGGKFEVEQVQFVLDDKVVETVELEVFKKDVQFGVKINNGQNLSDKDDPTITWEIVGDSLNCLVDEDGLVQIGNVLGDITLACSVQSVNKITKTLPIKITKKEGSNLQSLSASINDGFSTAYIEGQTFDRKSIKVVGHFENYSAVISDFDVESGKLETGMTDIAISYCEQLFIMPISVSHKQLESIRILNAPNKTNYVEGQIFDKTGIVIEAIFDTGKEESGECFVDDLSPLEISDTEIEIFFEYNGITKSAKQAISVAKRQLSSISINDENVKKRYVQGEKFDASGIRVFAEFVELGQVEVFDFEIDQKNLTSSDAFVNVTYAENGVTKSATISDLIVTKPYEDVRRINVENPSDVTISWTYSYMNDEGEMKIDNLTFLEHSLTYDVENGIYDVPVSASVTLKAINPAVVDFVFDGQSQNMDYSNMTKIFVLEHGEQLNISTIQMAGERLSISFSGDGKTKNFLYSKTWNAPLRSQDVSQLFLIFKDCKSYYYTYKVDDKVYSAAELTALTFNKSCMVVVEKVAVKSNLIEVTFEVEEDLTLEIMIDPQNFDVLDFPSPQKAGFLFGGWKYADGTLVGQDNMKAFLQNGEVEHYVYAVWTKEVVDYSTKDIIGKWTWQGEVEGYEILCEVEFMSDATFSYEVCVAGEKNNSFTGSYRLEGEDINIIIVETDGEHMLLSPNDFMFEKEGDTLRASIFVFDGYALLEDIQNLAKLS